jgi:hypothetical protein
VTATAVAFPAQVELPPREVRDHPPEFSGGWYRDCLVLP